jgi:peptide/nickel transport system substrate-binding protein
MRLLGVLAMAGLLAAAPASAQQRQNAITWGFHVEIETLDPYATGKGTVQLVIRNVLEHLLMRDNAGTARPALATAWTWVDDRTIDFDLRKGVVFHDGQPFDADDVLYTIAYIKKPDSKISAQGDYAFIEGFEKLDSHKVRLKMTAPTPSAVDRLTQTFFVLPKGAHAKMSAQEFAAKPVGTGPYMAASFEAGRRAELVKNPNYYDAAWGKPRFDRVTVLSVIDAQTRMAELTAGRVDFVWNITPDQVEALKGNRSVVTVGGNSTSISFLSMDSAGRSGANPMQDRNVRMAIAHAIDRKAISEVLRGGSSVVINAPCHPQQFGCPNDLPGAPRDLAKAREFLKQSAHPNGFEIAISAFTDSGPVAEAIVGDLREIGIKATVDFRETSAWVRDFFAGKLPVAVVPWPSNGVYDVSAIAPFFFMSGQGDYFRDAEVTEWFKTAGSINDAEQRRRLYRQGFEKMAKETFALPLMTNVTNYAHRQGLDFTPAADGYPLIYLAGWKN